MKGVANVVRNLSRRSPDECAISAVTAYELCTGIEKCADPEKERAKLNRLLETVHLLTFERNAAQRSARVRAHLESAGTPIGPYDTLIAGHALAIDLVLVTHNIEEFSRVPELPLLNWRDGEATAHES